jgi:hypothetical protein
MRGDEIRQSRPLEQIPLGTGADRRADVLFGGVHAEDQHLRLGHALTYDLMVLHEHDANGIAHPSRGL